jgi:acetyl-CoA C-acetyltransferase
MGLLMLMTTMQWVCADLCAAEQIPRREDKYAMQSYDRSAKAWEAGKFDNEIIPVAVPQRKGDPIMVSKDEEYTNVKWTVFLH